MKAVLMALLVIALSHKATAEWCGIGCDLGCKGLGFLVVFFGKRSTPCAERPDVLESHKQCETDNMSALKAVKDDPEKFCRAQDKVFMCKTLVLKNKCGEEDPEAEHAFEQLQAVTMNIKTNGSCIFTLSDHSKNQLACVLGDDNCLYRTSGTISSNISALVVATIMATMRAVF